MVGKSGKKKRKFDSQKRKGPEKARSSRTSSAEKGPSKRRKRSKKEQRK